MTIIMGWLANSRAKQRPRSDANTLRHPIGILVIGILGFAFFAGIAVVSNTIGKNSTTTIWTTFVFLFFAAMSLAMVADYFFGRHYLRPEGLEYGKLHGQRGYSSWAEIRSVTYAPVMKWFVLRTASGATIRISAMLMGLPAFAQHVLAHVSPEGIDNATRALLLETADGNPPSVWS
jgi:hypothetical protein